MHTSHPSTFLLLCVLLVWACGSTPSSPSQPRPASIGAAIAAVERAASYRMEVAVTEGRTMFRHEHVVVRRPEPSWSLRVESASGVTQVVVIGDRAWIAEEGRGFQPATRVEADSRAAAYDLPGILRPFSDPALSGILGFAGRERKHGFETLRYRADASAIRQARPAARANASLDVWIAVSGRLAALEALGVVNSDTDVRVDVPAVDDPNIRIQPPG